MRKMVSVCALLLLFCSMAFAQMKTVSGTVKDNKGDPVAFASVKIPGSKSGVSADENGFYRIQVPSNTTKLVFSATGTTEKTIDISGQGNVVNITLSRNT